MLVASYRNCYNPDSMNSLDGARPVVGGLALSVDGDGRVLVDGRRPEAGDGVARALARLVVDDVAAEAPERGIAVDQTNTSVIVDDRLVVKIVGRWAAADRAGHLLERLAAPGRYSVTIASVASPCSGCRHSTSPCRRATSSEPAAARRSSRCPARSAAAHRPTIFTTRRSSTITEVFVWSTATPRSGASAATSSTTRRASARATPSPASGRRKG